MHIQQHFIVNMKIMLFNAKMVWENTVPWQWKSWSPPQFAVPPTRSWPCSFQAAGTSLSHTAAACALPLGLVPAESLQPGWQAPPHSQTRPACLLQGDHIKGFKHVEQKTGNAYTSLVVKTGRKRPLRRPKLRWEDDEKLETSQWCMCF